MTGSASGEPSLGDRLIGAGWRQGAIFKLPASRLAWSPVSNSSLGELTIDQHVPPVEGTHTLVVISQDCDIYADTSTEPYVEAMVCRYETDRGKINNADQRSVREFTLERTSGLLAVARYHVPIAKDVLLTLDPPQSWPGDAKRHERFRSWLGRRYTRPALPNDFVDWFVKPAENAVTALFKKRPAVDDTFNFGVREICIPFPPSDDPPYIIDAVIYLLEERALSPELTDAIETVHQVLAEAVAGEFVIPPSVPAIMSVADISLQAYEATFALFLEYVTYKGDDLRGAKPIRRL